MLYNTLIESHLPSIPCLLQDLALPPSVQKNLLVLLPPVTSAPDSCSLLQSPAPACVHVVWQGCLILPRHLYWNFQLLHRKFMILFILCNFVKDLCSLSSCQCWISGCQFVIMIELQTVCLPWQIFELQIK